MGHAGAPRRPASLSFKSFLPRYVSSLPLSLRSVCSLSATSASNVCLSSHNVPIEFFSFMLACDRRGAAHPSRVPDSLAGGPAWQHAYDRAVWRDSRCHTSIDMHALSSYPRVASACVCASCAVVRSVRSRTACLPCSACMLQVGGGVSVVVAQRSTQCLVVSSRRRCCRRAHFRRRWRAGRRRAQPSLRFTRTPQRGCYF